VTVRTEIPFDILSLKALFDPSTVAVIGASDDPTRIGGRVIAGNLQSRFQGQLFPVNPRREEVQGVRCYPSIAAIGTRPDLAVVAVPAAQVPEQIRACAAVGVRAAVVLSSGFAEAGPAGAVLQAEILQASRDGRMRLLGPNCMGFLNARSGLVASFTRILNPEAAFGGVCIVSQSGAVGAHFAAVMRARRMRYDIWTSTGNQADVDFADCVAYLAESGFARVVVGCLEGVTNGPKFVAALDLARARGLPVVVFKIGRSAVGSEAAATHTAALTGSSRVFDEIVRSRGAHNAASVEDAIDIAYACSLGKFPVKSDIGLVSTSGGFGVVMADTAAEAGLTVPPLPAEAQRRLADIVPFSGTRNPVDITGQYLNDESIIEPMVATLLEAGGHDAAIFYVGNPSSLPRLADCFEALASRFADRLLVFIIVGYPEVASRLEKAGCLVFDDPRRAVLALNALIRIAATRATPLAGAAAITGKRVTRPANQKALNEVAAMRLLADAGVPMLEGRLAKSPEEAALYASQLGFPVVLKVVSAEIQHKSDVGGVLLNVATVEEAAGAYHKIVERVTREAPGAQIEGVLVSPQIRGGTELILGVFRDEIFGPCILLGQGGVYAEILDDTVLRMAPLAVEQAREMITALKGARLLAGVRGTPPSDTEGLAQALAALSQFSAANADWLEGVDINPIIVLPAGQGAIGVDAVVTVDRMGAAL
jgi:acyl-CoA synthetase (NDP forming)